MKLPIFLDGLNRSCEDLKKPLIKKSAEVKGRGQWFKGIITRLLEAEFQRIPESWPHSPELLGQICHAFLVPCGIECAYAFEDKQQCSLLSQEAIC